MGRRREKGRPRWPPSWGPQCVWMIHPRRLLVLCSPAGAVWTSPSPPVIPPLQGKASTDCSASSHFTPRFPSLLRKTVCLKRFPNPSEGRLHRVVHRFQWQSLQSSSYSPWHIQKCSEVEITFPVWCADSCIYTSGNPTHLVWFATIVNKYIFHPALIWSGSCAEVSSTIQLIKDTYFCQLGRNGSSEARIQCVGVGGRECFPLRTN